MANRNRSYIKPAKREDGYFVPCYGWNDAPKDIEPTCLYDVEPMYRVFNSNPLKVAPTREKVDGNSYLIPVSSFDGMVKRMGVRGEILNKHYFYDTHDKLDIDTGRAVYKADAPKDPNACFRVEPCEGPAKDLGVCCHNLLAPAPPPLTDLPDELKSGVTAFENDLRILLSYKQPTVPVMVPTLKEETTPATELIHHKSNALIKWSLIMLSIFIVLVVTTLLIAFLI
jgi:hypothetical protein